MGANPARRGSALHQTSFQPGPFSYLKYVGGSDPLATSFRKEVLSNPGAPGGGTALVQTRTPRSTRALIVWSTISWSACGSFANTLSFSLAPGAGSAAMAASATSIS